MKHAYFILAHKCPKQLFRLVQALNSADTIFLVHIDSKIAILPFIKLFENYHPCKVYFCPNRKNITWGSFTMVEATLSLIRYYFKLGLEADYIHLLSGQDYPIQSVQNIDHFFEANNGRSFVNYFTLPTEYWPEKGMNRIQYLWCLNSEMVFSYNNLDYKNYKQPVLHLPKGITPYGGSQWWSLHKDCLRFLSEECTENNILYNFYRHALIPDEMFFHTLIMNSVFKDTIINDNLLYIKWEPGNIHPETLTVKHLGNLAASGKLFARKFESIIDSEVMDKLDEHSGRCISPQKRDQISSKKERWCIISAIGKASLHPNWIKRNPLFDLHLIVYDNSYEKFKNDTSYVIQSKGYKYKLIYNYLSSNLSILNKYDYFYIPDDDIDIDTANIHRLFRYMKEYNLAIAQPAISNSYYSYRHTMKRPNSFLRYTNFVEVMQPCFSADALKKVLFTFGENQSGWGIDFHWGELVNYHNYNMAIIDDIISTHTKPVQSIYQSNHHAELHEYLKKHNLTRDIKELH